MTTLTYEDFREQWKSRHPASVPQKVDIVLPYPQWLPGAVLVMFLSAVLLSAVHTIPTMYDAIPVSDVIGEVVRRAAAHAAVFVIELSLFIAVYASASGKALTYTIIECVAFVGALAANLHSVLSTVENGDIGGVIVGVIVGSLPPLVAALSGAVYVRMHRANSRARYEADSAYREDMKVLDSVILTAYKKYEKEASALVLSAQTDSRQTARLSSSVLSDQTDNRQTLPAASGYERTPDGQRRVIDFLTEYPDAAQMPSRHLAARIEEVTGVRIGHDTANKGRNAWAQQREAAN